MIALIFLTEAKKEESVSGADGLPNVSSAIS